MNTSFSIPAVVILVGSIHAFILATVLAALRRNVVANRFLAALLFTFALDMGSAFLYETHYVLDVPYLANITAPFSYAYLPLLYLYLKFVTMEATSFRWRQLLHFVPSLLRAVTLVPFYVLGRSEKIAVLTTEFGQTPVMWKVMSLLFLIQAGVYSALIVRLLARHAQRIRQTHSSLGRVELKWIRNLSYAMFVGLIVYSVRVLFFYNPGTEFVGPVLLAGLTYAIGYAGFQQPDMVSEMGTTAGGPKYEKSALKRSDMTTCAAHLQALMEKEAPYRDPEITLATLARRLDVSTHHLSQVLNQGLNQTFYDFINGQRVNEACRLLRDPARADMTKLEIAYHVGFNSKSAFNAAFKRATGVTPTAYANGHEASVIDGHPIPGI